MTFIRKATLLSLLLLPAVTWAAEEVPLYKDIKNWVVVCDNTRHCTAISAEEDQEHAPLSLRIDRDAGPQGEVQLSIAMTGAATEQPLLDGKPLKSTLQKGGGDDADNWVASGPQAQALIDELRNGTRLSMTNKDDEGSTSLDGFSASLLLVDAVQERVGTQGALLKRGNKPDSSVPPAPLAPQLAPFIKARALSEAEQKRIGDAVLKATRADWDADHDADENPSVTVDALNDSTVLVIIQTSCAAYNCSYALYQTSAANPEKAELLDVDEFPGEDMADELTGYVEYDADTGVLSSHDKGRGIGDCGASQSWRYDGKGFRPRSFAMMSSCAGNPSPWPVMWRTRD
ncbi:hypothetical protein M2401_006475 [Pseudomonas sp. JUb42]|jgi:hypothetical protein|uniref:DUF1176 domain-containing protein n=1 Tax=Pseudomonas sp. JUb42 TaxID=2940611 RepID=UPI0021677C34|nr:DUF1176 domain-containing protein [Pseudomonas sp. JUb42]MCS3472710.1 hypothetical protein [Pseudomonas sp. JUb42]